MTDTLQTWPFSVSLVDEHLGAGLMRVVLSFNQTLSPQELQAWNDHLRKTIGFLAVVGGCGGAVVAPTKSNAVLLEQPEVIDVPNEHLLYGWNFHSVNIDPGALVVLGNLIEHANFNLVDQKGELVPQVRELVIDSPQFSRLNWDKLDLPDPWPAMPFELNDYSPASEDFDIEIEFTKEVNEEVHDKLERMIKPWLRTLERGGFHFAHPRKPLVWGLDTSHEPLRRTPLSMFVQIRGLYADYRAVFSLFNILARAHQWVHPIAAVHVGE
ncbi:MAG: hypothetical protein HEQ39_08375 [Rhizobacter sp.]